MTNTDHSTAVSGAEDRVFVGDAPERKLLIDFMTSESYDPNPKRRADTVEAAIRFTLARLASTPQAPSVIPDGWRLVPAAPTAAMLCAYMDCPYDEADDRWSAMLAASPLAALAQTPDRAGAVREALVEDHNAAFDPADEAGGDAFRAGFREGWIFAQSPDGADYDELGEQYGRAFDIEPSEAWSGYRDEFFARLPLAAIPDVGSALAATTSVPAISEPTDADADRRRLSMAEDQLTSALNLRGSGVPAGRWGWAMDHGCWLLDLAKRALSTPTISGEGENLREPCQECDPPGCGQECRGGPCAACKGTGHRAAFATPDAAPIGQGWKPIATAIMWECYVVTDGLNVAASQYAESDHGDPYWSIDPEDALEWEPTHCIQFPNATPIPSPAKVVGDAASGEIVQKSQAGRNDAAPIPTPAPQGHEYGPSRVGHGEAQCIHCLATNRENAVIAPNICSARNPTPAPVIGADEAGEDANKAWCLKMAAAEGDCEIGAGSPDHPLRSLPIPAGMVPWHGGERAPDDWDGGPVLWREGTIGVDARWFHATEQDHREGRWLKDFDIIAYTPAALSPAGLKEEG